MTAHTYRLAKARTEADHQYRLAQAPRLIRLCAEVGVSNPEDLTPEAIANVCDDNGKIKPEPQDMVSA